MSQYILTPKDPRHEILIGWDPSLNTLFLHVWDKTKDEDDETRDVIWVPENGGIEHSVPNLLDAAKEFAELSYDDLTVLAEKITMDMD